MKIEAPYSIAIVVSHPIQHFCPQYVSFAENENIQLRVFFGSALGYKKYVDENFKQEISWGNLQLERFDHVFLNGEVALPSDKNLDAVSVEMELAAFAPDLMIVYGYFQKLQRRAYAWATKNNVPLAYISDSELRHHDNPLRRLVKSVFLRRYFSRISYFLSVGDANEAFYAKHGVSAKKMLRMHFPIDVQQYSESYQYKDVLRTEIREQYCIPDEDIVVAVVGKLAPWKSQEHLIDALLLLEEEGLYIHLFILGSGVTMDLLKKKAKRLVNSRVFFPGFVDTEVLPAYYAAADIYAHPASKEPHSIAISEAIYMGCPVVLSDRCGSYGDTDDVQPGRNGFVFPYADIKALANQIKRLAISQTEREKFGRASHTMAEGFQTSAHFNIIQQLTDRFLENSN